MNEQTKKVNKKKFIIMLTALLAIVITVLSSSYVIFNELEEQLQQNLEDVATQNALALHNKIHSNYELLQSLSKNMHDVTPDNITEKLRSFEIFLDEYDLKRFAYSFPEINGASNAAARWLTERIPSPRQREYTIACATKYASLIAIRSIKSRRSFICSDSVR